MTDDLTAEEAEYLTRAQARFWFFKKVEGRQSEVGIPTSEPAERPSEEMLGG